MRVTDNLNHLLPNAPVTFTVTQGGTLQATASGTIAAALTVKTNAYGRAIVYFQLPNTPNAQFQIAARPATGRYSNSVLFVENSDAGSGSHGTPTLPPDNPQGGGGNPPANNPPQIPVQYYAALDISGNNTDGENVTSVALDDNNHAAFAYMESGGHLIAKKWANGAVDSSFSNQTPMPDTVTLSLRLPWRPESMDYDFDRTLRYNYCVNASGTIYGTVVYRLKDNGPTVFGLGMTFTDSTAMPIDLFNSLTLLGYNEMAHDDESLEVLGCSANTYYGFTFHSGLWPDMGYVSKSGITTLFVANNCPWNPQESDTLKINYADGWFYPFMASDNGWAAGERYQGGLWDGPRTPAVWNANQEKVTDLGENNWPVGVNNQGYVLCGGSSGSNKATLWHADSSTDLKDLLPADYKSMLDSIKPKLISNADSGNVVNILFNATEIASGAAHDYVLQALTSGTNTLAQISLPDGVNADFHSLNASGIISSIGTLTTGTNASASTSAKKAILLLPVEVKDLKKVADENDDVVIEAIAPKKPDESENQYIQRSLTNKQIAYIEPHGAVNDTDPEMPHLVAKLPGGPHGLKVRWKLLVEYKSGNGYRASYVNDFTRPEDTVKLPASGEYTAEMDADQEWRIFETTDWTNQLAQNGFFGGTAKLYMWFPSQSQTAPTEPIITFRIGGKNPEATIAKAFIQGHLCDNRLWFAYAIAKKESPGYDKPFYNQFFGSYRKRSGNGYDQNKDWQCWAKGWPVYNIDRDSRNGPMTSAGGYGIFQVTGDAQSQWTMIPRRQIWNWQDNVGYQKNNVWYGAMGILKAKIAFVDARYNSLQGTYPSCGAIHNYPLNTTSTRKRLSGWDAYTCKGYNGYGGTQPLVDINGFKKAQWSTWHPRGNRWEFIDDGYTLGVWNNVEETH